MPPVPGRYGYNGTFPGILHDGHRTERGRRALQNRPVPAGSPARSGGYGGGLPGLGRAPGTAGRGQAHPARHSHAPGPRAAPPRGPGGGAAQPSVRGPDLRSRRGPRRRRDRHGVRRGAHAARAARGGGAAHRPRRAPGPGSGRRARGGPCRRPGAPRSQAGERAGHAGGARQDPRLRDRQAGGCPDAGGRGPHRRGRGAGNRPCHVARAGPRRRAGRPLRSVCAGYPALRAAHRHLAVPRQQRARRDAAGDLALAAGGVRPPAGGSARALASRGPAPG